MNLWIYLAGIGALIAMAIGVASAAQAGNARAGWPNRYSEMRSIGDVIKQSSGKTVHIFYVHGMRADSSGASKTLVQALLKSPLLPGAQAAIPRRHYYLLDDRPPDATIAGRRIWKCDPADQGCEAWTRSMPFLIETEITATDRRIVIHEVNWWPLMLGIKCRFLAVPEADLSGDARRELRLCARDVSRGEAEKNDSDPYFPWITSEEAERLIAARPRSGGGAAVNGRIKRDILNWGLADAVIALGPMKRYLHQTMDWAAERALKHPESDPRHILIAESLGSFIAMDASRDGPTKRLIEHTRDFYFIANQFALLELGRIRNLERPADGAEALSEKDRGEEPSPLELLQRRVATTQHGLLAQRPAQVVAINDPSDMLTYDVPRLCDIKVANLYWRFSGGLLRLLANPVKAHRGGVDNPRLWKMLLDPNDPPDSPAPTCEVSEGKR